MTHLKHLDLEGARNMRDLGGYPASEGRVTKWGLLYRSDQLSGLTGEDWKYLQERNVRTVIDLRSSREREASPVKAPEGTACFSYYLMKDLQMDIRNLPHEVILKSMKLDYVKTVRDNPGCLADIMKKILERMEYGAVVFLCSAGKDRTGIVAATILYLCGVKREDIIADYSVSSIYNRNGINRLLSAIPESFRKMAPEEKLLEVCFESRPETIAALLDDYEGGHIEALLDENGFSRADQARFATAFTDHE